MCNYFTEMSHYVRNRQLTPVKENIFQLTLFLQLTGIIHLNIWIYAMIVLLRFDSALSQKMTTLNYCLTILCCFFVSAQEKKTPSFKNKKKELSSPHIFTVHVTQQRTSCDKDRLLCCVLSAVVGRKSSAVHIAKTTAGDQQACTCCACAKGNYVW